MKLSQNERRLAEQGMVERARTFAAEHVRPNALAWQRGEGDSRDVLLLAAQAGLLGLQVPPDHGGQGLSFACKWRVAEVLAAADFGLAMSVINTHNVAQHLAQSAPADVASQWVPALLAGRSTGCTALTEPAAGSDFAAITTGATRVAGGWRLDGQKAWIVNATHAGVVVVYAQTAPGSGASGIAAFLVDAGRSGFSRSPPADLGAARSIDCGGFALQGFECRDDEMLHPPGQAFKAALASINGARVYVAAMCCGMVADCLRVANEYGTVRHTFGRSLHDHQGWRWSLADAAIELDAARALVERAAANVDAGRDAQGAAARAKVFATRMATRHIAALAHAMGAEGLREQQPLLRHLGAAQVATLVDGSTEMLLERVANELRKHPEQPAPGAAD